MTTEHILQAGDRVEAGDERWCDNGAWKAATGDQIGGNSDWPYRIWRRPRSNTFHDFTKRFEALKQEAASYGVGTVTVLLNDDALSREEGKCMVWSQGSVVTIGMLEWGKHHLLSEIGEQREIE